MEKHNANECPDCGGRVTKFVEHGLFGEERVRWVCVKGRRNTMDASFEAMIKAVEEWSSARGIDKADPAKQMLKLTEEVGELAAGIVRNRKDMIYDAIGDVLVVMIILCQQLRIPMISALQIAYRQIKNREGETVNGVFVKREDLQK